MKNRYYGAQTAKALKNFPFSGGKVSLEWVRAMAEIKLAAAKAHAETKELPNSTARAIVRACKEIIAGQFDGQFKLPALQGGAGTSLHMNVNEVIACRAAEILGKPVHPNDDVNGGQSTNDVNPSALRIACLRLSAAVERGLGSLIAVLDEKAKACRNVRKIGRTHLQDAVPTTLSAELAAHSFLLKRDLQNFIHASARLRELNLGGTAIGNAVNAPPLFRKKMYQHLARATGLRLVPAANPAALTFGYGDFLALSQALVIATADASKFADDLRLLASGPRAGLMEIQLPELQAGSSIMPGKINPVLPETVNQLYYLVSGNNNTIEQSVAGAQLELNVFGPVLGMRLIESLRLTAEVLPWFAKACVRGLTPNTARCRSLLENSTAYAALLAPELGYDAVAGAVRRSLTGHGTLRDSIVGERLLTERQFRKLTGN